MTATASEVTAVRVVGALSADPRRPECVRVMVQGRPLLTLPREVAVAERLAAGMVLDDSLLARLGRAADAEAAFRTLLRFVERRPFAARDLARRLVLKGHPPEAAAAAVERAGRAGLVDDERFARHYIDTRSARGRGPLRLRRDLSLLGIAPGLIDRALAEALGPDGSGGADVEALARKRLAQLKGLARPVARRRLLAFLARRGFVGEPVHRLVASLIR